MHPSSPLVALSSGALAWPADRRARVLLRGPDTRPFLHRMSTNHVSELRVGDGCLNAFLSDKGRLIDLVHHLDRGDEGVLLVGSAGRGAALLAWLDRFIFTEAIELADLSEAGSCVEVAGVAAPAQVEALIAGAAALPPWGFAEQDGRIVARGFDRVCATGAPVPSFVVVDLLRPALLEVLQGAGATAIGLDGAEALRVAAGVPGEVGELTEAHNPLDLALHDAIHWAKGCYIGQEVIARLDTYGKQGKRLVGLAFDADALARVGPGDAVWQGEQHLGVVTSVSPLHNGVQPSALAVIKGAHTLDTAQVRHGDAVVDTTVVSRVAAQSPHD